MLICTCSYLDTLNHFIVFAAFSRWCRNFMHYDVCTIVTDVAKVAEYLTVSEMHHVELDALICQTVWWVYVRLKCKIFSAGEQKPMWQFRWSRKSMSLISIHDSQRCSGFLCRWRSHGRPEHCEDALCRSKRSHSSLLRLGDGGTTRVFTDSICSDAVPHCFSSFADRVKLRRRVA